jgi:hypothetical protein
MQSLTLPTNHAPEHSQSNWRAASESGRRLDRSSRSTNFLQKKDAIPDNLT